MTSARDSSIPALRLRALPCALAAALAAMPSHALMLGEPEVRSYLGRPLDLRIPVQGAGAEAADASCFGIVEDARGGVNALPPATIEVEQAAGHTYLRVRSSDAIAEPASVLRVRAACSPAKGVLVREYGILLDPMPASAPSAPLVAHAASGRDVARASTARAVPSAAPPAVRVKPHRTVARRPHAPVHETRAHPAPVAAHVGFHLKLSGPVLDLEPSRHVTEAQRAYLREARTLMDGDDYASAMLALRDRIDTLQQRLEALQAQAARVEASPRAQPAGTAAPPRKTPPRFGVADVPWAWTFAALLALLALLMPVSRWLRRRKPAERARDAARPRSPDKGTETGRFAPPPPRLLEPAAPAAPVTATAAAIAMEDTEDAIRTARELYNAGDRLQAAGVLRFAIESHPERVAPWLPLFDLLVRERLATEYAELARGFLALHRSSPAWRTVRRAGPELDPSNPLYADEGAASQVAA